MTVDLKPYDEYQESGLVWLGKVPSHWRLPRLGSIFAERKETNERRSVSQVLSVLKGIGVIRYEEKGNIGNKRSEDTRRYKIVRPDDIVVNCMNVIIGSVGRSQYTGCLSPIYYVLTRRSQADNPKYLAAVFATKPFHESLVRIGNGILAHRMRIPMELLKCELFPIPPPKEQAAIVRFLDWANGRLERATRAKRKVIALLNEQKQAIIHRAVTRGLDPAAPLKPSGIPWIGEIPEHWELWRISRFARVGNGSTPSRGKPSYWNGGTYPWLNSSQVNRSFIDSADQFVTETALRECHLPKVLAGSVLVAITGQGKTRGMSAVLGTEATINQHLAFITPRAPVALPQFIHSGLCAAYRQLRALSEDSGSTKGAITCEDLKRFKLVIPPIEEQTKLVAHIQSETRDLTSAISRLEREIDLLREYRTRLVADVVTGKLDVRFVELPERVDSGANHHGVDLQAIETEDDLLQDEDEASEVKG
jgi:type I restriction enzyme S subunit